MSESTPKHVVLAGGGTAGHTNPLLATAVKLRDFDQTVTVLGTKEGLEADLVPAAGFSLTTLPKVPIPRRPSWDYLTLPTRLCQAIQIARKALATAHTLVGFGGYVSAPAYLAAHQLGVPIVVHEQNLRAGWANKLGAKYSKVVALTFEDTNLKSWQGLNVITGLPLRAEIADLAEQRRTSAGRRAAKQEGAEFFDLDPQLPTLLVTGGSLGAQRLNQVLVQAASDLPSGLQIIHLTGKGKSREVQVALENKPESVTWVVREYLTEMHFALAAADLVLCRAGASTVAELGALGLPAFYVPLPIGNGEQSLNASGQVQAGGAKLVEDAKFTLPVFQSQVVPLLLSEPQLRKMGQEMRGTFAADGAERLAKIAKAVAK